MCRTWNETWSFLLRFPPLFLFILFGSMRMDDFRLLCVWNICCSPNEKERRERERERQKEREREREGATLRAISLPETPKAQHSTWRYISPKAPAVAAVQARGKHKNQNVSPFTEMEAIFFGLEELVRLVFPSLKNKSNAILKQIKSGRNKIYVSWINS